MIETLPPGFLLRMQALLGSEYAAFLASYQQPPVTGLRINTLKIAKTAWETLISYTLSPVPWCPTGYVIQPGPTLGMPNTSPPGKHPFHAAGLYYLQDPSAMAAAELLAPQPGERVLDLAAAPGGKSTHLAVLMQGEGLLVANEIHPQRAWDLAQNLERCGVRNAAILNETPARLADHFGAYFDRVLLDAPCSGEGMFRKSAIARQEWKPGLVLSCAIRQDEILSQAARLVRAGGWLGYTTCTFAPEENEAVIDRFLTDHPEFELCPVPTCAGFEPAHADWITPSSSHPLEHAIRLWPHRLNGEGHFVAVLRKADDIFQPAPVTRSFSLHRPDRQAYQHFRTFWEQSMTSAAPDGLHQSGTYVYQLPAGLPELGNLKQLHPGWWLGSLKTGRFEPSHALALGVKASQVQRTLELEQADPQLLAYLRGNSLSIPGEAGWLLITVLGYPISWGKRSAGVIKNVYPRGLRWQG